MIDMTELMFDPDFIQPEPVHVIRTSGAYDGNGLWMMNAAQRDLDFIMIIQQSTMKQLQALPEGERNGDFISWWLNPEQILADGVTPQESDVILWRDKHYRIIRCSDRSDNGFYNGIAQAAPFSGGTDDRQRVAA